MANIFVNLGPRAGGELFNSVQYRAFIKLRTRSKQTTGSKKLRLMSNGQQVGFAVIRWWNVKKRKDDQFGYLIAQGVLDDIEVGPGFSEQKCLSMIRDAFEQQKVSYYQYTTRGTSVTVTKKFHMWIQQKLQG